MKSPYAVVDVSKDPLLDSIAVGPLTEDETLRVPSDRLIWPKNGETPERALMRVFEAPPGFTRIHELGEGQVNRPETIISVHRLAHEQFGIELPPFTYFGKKERYLSFFGQLKYWMISRSDIDLMYDVAKRVKVLFHKSGSKSTRIGRRKGYVVDDVSVSWNHSLAILQYDLAEWTKRKAEAEKRKKEDARERVDRQLLIGNEAGGLYWGMVRVLGRSITGRNRRPWMTWDSPPRTTKGRVAWIISLHKIGVRLFGKNYWKNRIDDCGSLLVSWTIHPRSGYSHRPIAVIARKRHRELKLERPPASKKADRFIWDLLHKKI